jgi:hypothetical protein
MDRQETVLVIEVDGSAVTVPWPAPDDGRADVLSGAVGGGKPRMIRCGKGILGFCDDAGESSGLPLNPYARRAFEEQGIELAGPLHGPVVFARNPSKGSIVKALTDAQAANLLVVTGARLSDDGHYPANDS